MEKKLASKEEFILKAIECTNEYGNWAIVDMDKYEITEKKNECLKEDCCDCQEKEDLVEFLDGYLNKTTLDKLFDKFDYKESYLKYFNNFDGYRQRAREINEEIIMLEQQKKDCEEFVEMHSNQVDANLDAIININDKITELRTELALM